MTKICFIFSGKRPYDDYEEDYEYERPRQRKRPRPSSRRTPPLLKDEPDRVTEDRKFDRRPLNDRREYSDDRRSYSDDRRPYNTDRRKPDEEQRSYTDERRSIDDDRRPYNSDRRSPNDNRDRKPLNEDRKPPIIEEKKVPLSEERERRPLYDRTRPKNRNEDRRKDYEDESSEKKAATVDDSKYVKPSGPGNVGSVYDRPRVAPKISRPVPLSERNKFAFKTTEKPKPTSSSEEYYDEEYEDVPLPPSSTVATSKSFSKNDKPVSREKHVEKETPRKIISDDPDEEYYDDYEKPKSQLAGPQSKTNRDTSGRPSPFNTNQERLLNRYKANSEKYAPRFNKEIVQPQTEKPQTTTTRAPEQTTSSYLPKPFVAQKDKKYANKQTVFETPVLTTTTHASIESLNDYDYERDQRPTVKVIKRPFLPSRGGNPYKARGLQPVGSVAATFNYKNQEDTENEARKFFDQPEIKQISQDQYSNVNSKPKNYYNYQTEDQVKTTLEDIYNEDFDVNINDALNPTLRPLSSSSSRIDEYSYDDRPYFTDYRKPQQSFPEQKIAPSINRPSKINLAQSAQRRIFSSTTTSSTTSTTTTSAPPALHDESEYIYEEYEDY